VTRAHTDPCLITMTNTMTKEKQPVKFFWRVPIYGRFSVNYIHVEAKYGPECCTPLIVTALRLTDEIEGTTIDLLKSPFVTQMKTISRQWDLSAVDRVEMTIEPIGKMTSDEEIYLKATLLYSSQAKGREI